MTEPKYESSSDDAYIKMIKLISQLGTGDEYIKDGVILDPDSIIASINNPSLINDPFF